MDSYAIFFIQIHTFRPQIHHSGSPPKKKWVQGLGFGGISVKLALTLPTSKNAFYNIWPSVEPRKTQLFHDIWSPFWHLFLVDSTPGAWGSPWEHPGSTFASRPHKTFKKKTRFFGPHFKRYSEHIFMFFNLFFNGVFQRP